MKNLLRAKTLLLLGLLVFVFSVAVPVVMPAPKVHADINDLANTNCARSAHATECKIGFIGGYNGTNNACSRTSGAARTACNTGYNIGKAANSNKAGGNSGNSGGSNSGNSSGSSSGSSSSSGSTSDDGASGSGPAGAEASPAPGPEHIDCDKEVVCEDPAASGGSCDNNGCDLIGKYVNPAITALSALVGVAAVASLIYGGIQYSTSNGDPQNVAQAKDRIVKTLIAFVMYLFLFAFLQFIVPGGVFK